MIQHLSVLASGDRLAIHLANRLESSTTISFTERVALADRLAELALVLPHQPRSLDLIGLTSHDKLLSFHGRPLDTSVKRVRAFYRELADAGILAQLGITAMRLVGCCTAVGERARRTISMLSEIIGLEVTGTQDLVSIDDFETTGFTTAPPRDWSAKGALLDLDALQAEPLTLDARPIAQAAGREVLAHVRRAAGVALPCLLAVPHAELALPSVTAGLYYRLEVLLDYELVRANIRGASVVFPVDDPRGLRALLEA